MKTTNNVQKTENRNFRNSVMNYFAAVIGLVLIGTAAEAHDYRRKNSTTPECQEIMASAAPLIFTSSIEYANSSASIFVEIPAEESLELEDWMTRTSYFETPAPVTADETEDLLRIEEWMFGNQNFKAEAEINQDELALKIEAWMLDESIWGK